MKSSAVRTRSVPLALAGLIALLAALVALAFSGGEPAQAHATVDKAPVTAKQLALRNDMRQLWEDHIVWTRMVIVSFAADLPDLNPAIVRLLQNQGDIGDAIKPFYGDAAGNQLTALLRDHIIIAADVLAAAKAGDTEALTGALDRWYANGEDIADFLAAANPASWPQSEMRAMMREHLDLTTQEAVARLTGDWEADIAAYDEIHLQILEMADMLSTGIISDFPRRFR
jgi:hypothetical protein